MSKVESDLDKFSRKMEKDLVSLVNSKHPGSGKLAKSIKVNFKKVSNGYSLNIEANDYIKFLDDGKFLEDFLKEERKNIVEVITKAVKQDIIKEIKK